TTIGNAAFRYCRSLTSVTIPNSVTTIGKEVFYGCKSLTSVIIGNSVTTIGDGAFVDCYRATFIVRKGSYAEEYVMNHGIPFEIYFAYGDIDEDFKVAAADALEVLKSVVGKTTLTEDQFKAADTDGSGKADAADALNILKKVVGKIDQFPVEG
ncbi:MAG: leucine-rich repeat protein, partial [Clostridia bacterium]|nr:leucine-rich repeat protein [Clostridia bacterium]